MAKQIRTEDEFTLQRQARRRLIGAVALMLAVVIFLPMIFDPDPAAPDTREIELRIPENDPAAGLPPAADTVAQQTAANAVEPAPANSEYAPPATESAAPATESAAPAKAAANPVEKSIAKPVAKPLVAAPAKPASKPAGWMIQVGAYSKPDAARQMADNLKQRGYPVHTEQAGKMMRVRVGGYPSKEAADKVRARLEAIGLHPDVINVE